MPELPEVEALAAFLRERASGHIIARADAASFAVLKTFGYDDPPARSILVGSGVLSAVGALSLGPVTPLAEVT